MGMQQPNAMMGMANNTTMGMQQPNNNIMGGSSGAAAANPTSSGGDDKFGDFEDAGATGAAKTTATDPLSTLISLDGLKKNETKTSQIDEPIIANSAAAQ